MKEKDLEIVLLDAWAEMNEKNVPLQVFCDEDEARKYIKGPIHKGYVVSGGADIINSIEENFKEFYTEAEYNDLSIQLEIFEMSTSGSYLNDLTD